MDIREVTVQYLNDCLKADPIMIYYLMTHIYPKNRTEENPIVMQGDYTSSLGLINGLLLRLKIEPVYIEINNCENIERFS